MFASRVAGVLLGGALFGCVAAAQRLEVNLVVGPAIQSRLASGAVAATKRQEQIQRLFEDAGCTTEEQRVTGSASNVICTLPGESPATIVVGAHFDFADSGKGIVDDWSGAALLPSLYQSLKTKPRHHTFVFIAFATEERGLYGSRQYVRKLSREQKQELQAFVNLECLGLTPPKVWVHRSTPALVGALLAVAHTLGTDIQGVNVDRVGDDDTHAFLVSRIPVISIHSITQDTLPILHSDRDRLEAIHSDEYYSAYRLVAYYLAFLDVQWPPPANVTR